MGRNILRLFRCTWWARRRPRRDRISGLGAFYLRGEAVFKTFVIVALLCGSAMAQDAKTVIANAQKALGDVKSITYSGSAKDVAFQQCGANSTDMVCRGTHDPMRPINNYVRVIDLTAPASRHTGATNNIGPGGSTALTP